MWTLHSERKKVESNLSTAFAQLFITGMLMGRGISSFTTPGLLWAIPSASCLQPWGAQLMPALQFSSSWELRPLRTSAGACSLGPARGTAGSWGLPLVQKRRKKAWGFPIGWESASPGHPYSSERLSHLGRLPGHHAWVGGVWRAAPSILWATASSNFSVINSTATSSYEPSDVMQ